MLPERSVYFLAPVGGGNIKIGCSYSPRDRLCIFTNWSPVPLELLAEAEGYLFLERAIQERFAEHRLHGEWFAPAPELMAFIADVLAKGRIPLHGLNVRVRDSMDRARFASLRAKEAAAIATDFSAISCGSDAA